MNGLPESLTDGPELVFSESGYEELWAKLGKDDPARTAMRSGAESLGDGRFLIKMVGGTYLFDVARRRVTGPNDRPVPEKRAALSLLHYLAEAADVRPCGRLVPETVLPGGERFFSGGHALSRQPVLDVFGQDGPAFLRKAATLGAEPVEAPEGSFSFRLDLLPKIPVQVTLSQADDEFPAALSFAFDATAGDHVPLAILSALVGQMNACLIR